MLIVTILIFPTNGRMSRAPVLQSVIRRTYIISISTNTARDDQMHITLFFNPFDDNLSSLQGSFTQRRISQVDSR